MAKSLVRPAVQQQCCRRGIVCRQVQVFRCNYSRARPQPRHRIDEVCAKTDPPFPAALPVEMGWNAVATAVHRILGVYIFDAATLPACPVVQKLVPSKVKALRMVWEPAL